MQAFLLILSLAIIVEALVQYAKTIITMLENKQYKTFGTQLAAIFIAVFICFAAGADIFALMGTASFLLQMAGMHDQNREMIDRVTSCSDYNKALLIISEYVETELSVKPPVRSRKERDDAR